MDLDYIPLLHKQRELQGMPRSMERFREYLKVLAGEGDEIVAPLVAMNPMGKQHVTDLLDELLARHADEIAERAMREAAERLTSQAGSCRVSLVVVDDAMGGWTERYSSEMGFRFAATRPGSSKWLKQPWLAVPLWTGDAHTNESIRRATLAAIGRTALRARRGAPVTLRSMLAQEGLVYAFAGLAAPPLDADELAYAADVIGPHLDSSEYPTLFACIWGDQAASALGYAQLGLPPQAGLAVAVDAAQRRLASHGLAPDSALEFDPAHIL